MNSMELPLVLFTVLSQIAVGLTVFTAARQWRTSNGESALPTAPVWVASLALLVVAMIASLFHLGDPLGGPRAILNLGSAWLSREILFVILFGAGIIVSYVLYLKNSEAKKIVAGVTAALGLLLLISTGMVYSEPGFPALNNGIPVFYSLLTAMILGAAFLTYFAAEQQQPFLVRIVTVGLIVGLVVNLLIPGFWLSGGKAMQMTGQAYYQSAFYWLQIFGEYAFGLAIIGFTRKIPKWLPIVLLAGELLGRIAMYALAVHASTNIGGL